MPRNVWSCECCGSVHDTEDGAVGCEKLHPALAQFEILNVIFSDKRAYGTDYYLSKVVPTTIIVRFGPERGEFATYKLDHIGFKGV